MNRQFQRTEADRTKMVYATPADFCRVFNDQADSLYTLSLLLTADHHQARECFVASLDDCLHGTPVFREWVESWARRTVIKNAIRMIAPLRSQTGTATANAEPLADSHTAVAAITSLPRFGRFVYVLSVLERYSDRECATLLDCTAGQVVETRTQALKQLVGVDGNRSTEKPARIQVAGRLNQSYGEAS